MVIAPAPKPAKPLTDAEKLRGAITRFSDQVRKRMISATTYLKVLNQAVNKYYPILGEAQTTRIIDEIHAWRSRQLPPLKHWLNPPPPPPKTTKGKRPRKK